MPIFLYNAPICQPQPSSGLKLWASIKKAAGDAPRRLGLLNPDSTSSYSNREKPTFFNKLGINVERNVLGLFGPQPPPANAPSTPRHHDHSCVPRRLALAALYGASIGAQIMTVGLGYKIWPLVAAGALICMISSSAPWLYDRFAKCPLDGPFGYLI